MSRVGPKSVIAVSGPRFKHCIVVGGTQALCCLGGIFWFQMISSLQPLELKDCTVPHLKDLHYICLENESLDHGMNFNMIYDRSKYPHFISYRGFFNAALAFRQAAF